MTSLAGRCGRLLLLVSLLGLLALAQTEKASLSGVVTDPTGAVVPHAQVVATERATNTQQSTTSNASGSYTLPLLNTGVYDVTATAPGFETARTSGVQLQVGSAVTVNFSLQLGSAQTEATVNASSLQLLETSKSDVSQTIEAVQVDELPLQDRNVMALVRLVPGIVPVTKGFAIGAVGNRNFFDSGFSINGGRTSSNEVLLDGIPDTIGDFNGVAVIPPQGSVNEFSVVSGDVSAQYGRTSGGVVNITTKSGGNKFHGELYEYLQNSALNANSWSANRNHQRRTPSNRHHFGASVSGPVRIPGVYNGHDKTFFFFDYEGRREHNPADFLTTVPTDAERNGDFSNVFAFNKATGGNQLIQVYDPLTTTCVKPGANGNCAQYGRTAFANNVIPQNRIDPVALALLKYWPKPNLPGDISGANNYAFAGSQLLHKNLWDLRLDHTFSPSHSVFGRYTQERRFNQSPDYLRTGASDARTIFDSFYNFVVGDTYSLTPSLINDFRLGYARARANQVPIATGFDPTRLGLPSYIRDRATILMFPSVDIGGNVSVIGLGGRGYNNQPRDTESVSEGMLKVVGNHTLHFGAEFRQYRFYPFQIFSPTGDYGFGAGYTQANPLKSSSFSGLGFATFLLGATNGSIEYQTPLTIFHHYVAGYAEDNWRVTPKLTVNTGLRWELETGTAEAHDRLTYFDLNAPSPLQAQVPSLKVPGLLQFTGQGNPRSEWAAPKKNFAPRVGFAYAPSNNMTVRGGFGIFYLPMSLEAVGAQGVNISIGIPQPNPLIPQTFLSNPFPNGLQGPPGRSAGALTGIGQPLNAIVRTIKPAFNEMWDLAVQRAVGNNVVLEAAYVGSRGYNLPLNGMQIDQLNPQYLSQGAALVKQVPNPFYGVITDPNSNLSGKTVAQFRLLRPYPEYDGLNYFRPNKGASWYNSLQIKATKRYSNGLSFQGSYNWSKTMDLGGVGNGSAFFDATNIQNVYNLQAEKSLSDQDVPSAMLLSSVWDLPVGRKRHFLNALPGWADTALGGWQLAGSWIWQAGRPFTIGARNSNVGIGNAAERANLVAGQDPSLGLHVAQANARSGQPWFNINAFANPDPYTFGNSSRTLSRLRGDTYKTLDLSVHKYFQISQRIRSEFRAEAFNTLNMVVFSNPSTSLASPSSFGKVFGQDNQPRVVQFALRILY